MLDQLLQTVILGLIQGLAEWLPVSSTAHLRIAEHLLGFTATPLFNVVLHVGTLAVVLFYFRREVKSVLSEAALGNFKSEYGSLFPLIVVATVPTGIIGLLYVRFLEDTLQTFLIMGVTFIVGATVLLLSKKGKEETDGITYRMALVMGAAQGFAIFPGLSRSGVTISSALLLGLKREKAFKFSFLLSIPAVLGDLIVETYKQRGLLSTAGIGWPEFLMGILVAMIAGYVAIRIVSKVVASKRFHYFAAYTMPLGVALIVLALSGF